jgi:hypothetical protein
MKKLTLGLPRSRLFLCLYLLPLLPGSFLSCTKGPNGDAQRVVGNVPPYPPSPVIEGMTIGSSRVSVGDGDNWPMTWADDGNLYTVYHDGKGFGGSVVMSMGQAKIIGDPPTISGHNIPSPNGNVPFPEKGEGGGAQQRKASGMLMVNGVLYMWLRNFYTDGTGSTLAWSSDRAQNWTFASWNFDEIGYPVWLNFGQNYAGGPDNYLYFYSPNSKSAYAYGDTLILGRVHQKQVTVRSGYTFFSGLDPAGNPVWSSDTQQRQPIFQNPGRVFRPDAVYNAGLGRYFLSMMSHSRFPFDKKKPGGHFSVFDAPTPWGPWTTVHYDAAFLPNESPFAPVIPTKWMSADGTSLSLVYSTYPFGPYALHVQPVTLRLR